MMLPLLGAALGLGTSCIIYVDEDGETACTDVDCGANAFCDVGVCVCASGYAGDPDVNCEPVQSWLVRDGCDDGLDVEFKLFSYSRDWVWPSDGVYVTPGFDVDTQLDIQCSRGEVICFGGQAGETEWGVGIDGLDTCEACCFECEANTFADVGVLTCQ